MIQPGIAVDPIIRELRALAQQAPDLREAASVYEIILPLLRDADLHVAPLMLTPAEANTMLQIGKPLLHELDLALDEQAAYDLLVQLARAFETAGTSEKTPKRERLWKRSNPEPPPTYERAAEGDGAARRAQAAHSIRLALEQDRLGMGVLLPRLALGDNRLVTSLAEELQLDPALLSTLGHNALKPALRAWARQLTPMANGVEWREGYCFICGASATLGELQGNEQIKHLRCSQCGGDWEFRRVQCLYCGNQDHNTLSYFYPEGRRENLRLEVCERCHGYLKVIAAFSPTPVDLLPVQDLATLHLDYIAQARGYARVPVQHV